MMRLTVIPERASQRTQGVAHHARPTGTAGVQPSDFSAAAYAFGHAEDEATEERATILTGPWAEASPILERITSDVVLEQPIRLIGFGVTYVARRGTVARQEGR